MPKHLTQFRTSPLMLAMAGLLLASVAYSQESSMSGTKKQQLNSQYESPGKSSGGASSTGSAASGIKIGSEDEKMMSDLARSDMMEINQGKLAEKKSENEHVKSFAKKMVDDHTKALDDLKQLAKDKGVNLPTETDARQQAMENKLGSLSGAQFDRQYLEQAGNRAHRETHQLLQRISTRAKDTDLKSYANKVLPTIEDHQKMAKDARKELQSTSEGRSSGGKEGAGSMKENR